MQTATNPQTGEKIMWNGSAWVPAGASSAQSVTLGTPSPYKVQTQQLDLQDKRYDVQGAPVELEGKRLDVQGKRLENEGKQLDIKQKQLDNPVEKQRQNAISLLNAAGVDLEHGIDPISDLIKGSTSGPLQHIGAEAVGTITGDATPGMEKIAKLQTIASDLTLQLTGGSLGSQISNSDREFIVQRVGNIGDPNVPANQRLAAWEQVKNRMANLTGIQPKQTDESVRSELEARVRRGDDPADTIHWLVSIGRPPNKETVAAILANKGNANPDVRPPDGGGGLGHAFAVGLGGVAEGVGDLAGVVSNPFIQGVNYLAGTDFNPDMGENLRDTLGLPAPQNDQERTIATINNFGTQALGVGSAARALAPYVAPAANAVGGALERLGSAPLTDSAAGATSGAASDLTRRAGGGPVAQTAAGFAGGMASLPVSGRVNALMGASDALPGVVNAGRQEGVRVNRMMANPDLQPKATAVGKTMVGSRMLQREMRGIGGQIEGRVKALGGDGEALTEPASLGGAVQNVGKRFIKASGAEFKKHYGDLRKATADVPIPATQATAHIDSILGRLNKAPNQNAAEIKYLEGLKSDIANGIDVETARDIGSRLSRDISKGDITFGKSEADVLDIRKALTSDTETGLVAAGKGAEAAKYKEVDAAYAKRMDFIKQKLQGLLGKRNNPLDPEKAAGRLTNMAGKRGDASGLYQILNKATPEERADISATFAHMLGRAKDGAFSTARFVNDLEAMPTQARVALFGKDGAKSLENLGRLAAEHKRVTHALGGSPTGLGNDYRGILMNVVFGGGIAAGVDAVKGAAIATAGLGVKFGRDAVNAKLLMSPKFTGWLRSAPKTTNPQAINTHFDRLRALAVREPSLSPAIQRFQDAVLKAANENITPQVAASQPDQGN